MFPRYLINFDLSHLKKVYTDFLIVGSGIAGLYTSLKLPPQEEIILLTKNKLKESNTEYSQGGVAVALGDKDSPRLHMEDTLKAGANFCDSQAVKILVTEGPRCVEELIEMGTKFDKIEGKYHTTLEAAHQRPRILHAKGDATGAEIERSLSEKVIKENKIRIKENTLVIDILTDNNICYGLLTFDNRTKEIVAYLAKFTILASGGLGQLFSNTTNPIIATGDGIALAYRGGAKIANLEFIQFHPTALYYQGNPKFLISESVRGEGAILKNLKEERFMKFYHPLAELAPRDIVARAITDQMKKTKSNYVFLDATNIKDKFSKRFPTIYKNCMKMGINPEIEYIPVAPAAHYTMGGIKTDTWGQTNLTNLYACGECSNTGVHGANRLASNSLLEGLVFGNRISQKIKEKMSNPIKVTPKKLNISYNTSRNKFKKFDTVQIKKDLQKLMWSKVGITRTSSGLIEAQGKINQWKSLLDVEFNNIEQIELANLITIAELVIKSALKREESRGAHYRKDFPDRDDINWKKSIEY
ncbi:MAG: L-aspartate oxidase [Candidatus Caldatribacteriota bacterium]|nr:L-aspartate oxidase [Candidatus Caldatribacteriota bacterium]